MSNQIQHTNPSPERWLDEIERLARAYWETEGRPEGRHVEHWLRAEAELSKAMQPGGIK